MRAIRDVLKDWVEEWSRGEIDEAERLLTRYYRTLSRPFRDLVAVGDEVAIASTVEAYRGAGLDLLHLVPVARSSDQIERLARALGARLAPADGDPTSR